MPSAVTTYAAAAAAAYDAEEDSVRAVIVGAEVAVPTDQQSVLRQLVTLTTTNLGAAAVFTGPTLDAIAAARLTGMVTSDVAGVLDVQVSDDATTWYTPTARVTDTYEGAAASAPVEVAAGEVRTFTFMCKTRYMRLRYTNGAGAQAAFRLAGYLSAA
jgi:hypothetical protein